MQALENMYGKQNGTKIEVNKSIFGQHDDQMTRQIAKHVWTKIQLIKLPTHLPLCVA